MRSSRTADLTLPEFHLAHYVAPRVRITPVTEVISPEPIAGRTASPGHYQHLLLNISTGELRFHESTEHLEPWNPMWRAVNDVPRETWKRWHPGKAFTFRGPHMWFEPVPELLNWVIDSGTFVKELPYLDVEAANTLLAKVAPYAQALLDGLFDAGGELDWSAAAARAGRNIGRLCSRYQQAAGDDVDVDLVDYAEVVARFPQVHRPELLHLPPDRLADRCESMTRYLGCNAAWHPEIKKVFGKLSSDGTYVELDVLGVRAWYRTAIAQRDQRALTTATSQAPDPARQAIRDAARAVVVAALDPLTSRDTIDRDGLNDALHHAAERHEAWHVSKALEGDRETDESDAAVAEVIGVAVAMLSLFDELAGQDIPPSALAVFYDWGVLEGEPGQRPADGAAPDRIRAADNEDHARTMAAELGGLPVVRRPRLRWCGTWETATSR